MLDTKFPPPILLLCLALAVWLMSNALPGLNLIIPAHNVISVVIVTAGLALNIFPKFLFGKAKTTVNPMRPAAATELVTNGIYRYTRNPMYLGHALILFGWAIYLQHVAAFLAALIYVLYITRFQIKPEERILVKLFPVEYPQYQERVRRWL